MTWHLWEVWTLHVLSAGLLLALIVGAVQAVFFAVLWLVVGRLSAAGHCRRG
jgi:hypothetical protein